MINSIQKEIQVFIGEIVNQFNPERIILFGAHAYGNAKPVSDIQFILKGGLNVY
jgi:predicted nucleotidyltransferase